MAKQKLSKTIKDMNVLHWPLHKLIWHKIKAGIMTIGIVKNWPTFILDHFKMINSEYIIYKLRNGVHYKIKARELHRYMITESWIHKCYTKYFEVEDDYIVFDIGANIGAFSMLAAHYAKNGMVYSFEPEKESFGLLKENVDLNNFKNIELINKAVSNKTGISNFYISNTNAGGHSLYSSRADKKITIPTISFEEFIEKNKIKKIDFLKMDCEGCEYDILYNCSNETFKKIKYISMETHKIEGKSKAIEMAEFLRMKGFMVIREDEFIYAENKFEGVCW